MRMVRQTGLWFYALVVVLVIALVSGLFYMVKAGGGSLPVRGQAANFTGTDITHGNVAFNSLDGKVRLLTFFYTNCPDECPLTAHDEALIQEKLEQDGVFGKDVVFVSVSIDPKRDTLPVMKQWSENLTPDYNGWYFLHVGASTLPGVLKSYGIQTKGSSNPEIIEHTISTKLIDANGNIRKVYTTANLNVNEVYNDIQNLLNHQGS